MAPRFTGVVETRDTGLAPGNETTNCFSVLTVENNEEWSQGEYEKVKMATEKKRPVF